MKIDAISRVLSQYLNRPLVNEARQVLGYSEVVDEAIPPAAPGIRADGPPSVERGDLAIWAVRLPHSTRAWLRDYLGELDRLGVNHPLAAA